ncbi:MAG TPA: hypothetical protein VGF60_05715 [Xanthobacteraceae bacterium]|jgi:hypothetical protein
MSRWVRFELDYPAAGRKAFIVGCFPDSGGTSSDSPFAGQCHNRTSALQQQPKLIQ